MYYVYILRSDNNHLYIGVTNNVEKRVQRHRAGDGAEFTKRNKAFSLVYTESFESLLYARRRENQLKGWNRKKKENLINFGKPIVEA